MTATDPTAPMTAEQITCPEIVINIGGDETTLRFDNRAAQYAESYWRTTLAERMSYRGILQEVAQYTVSGLAAVAYGALRRAQERSGERPWSIAMFEQHVTFAVLMRNRDKLLDACHAYIRVGMPAEASKKA